MNGCDWAEKAGRDENENSALSRVRDRNSDCKLLNHSMEEKLCVERNQGERYFKPSGNLSAEIPLTR